MMNLNITFGSQTLGKDTNCIVVMPQNRKISSRRAGKDGKFKCLYLLHGLSDDATAWTRFTPIERYAEEHEIAVVMPDGGKSFYTNMKYGDDYYGYITRELPKIMEDMFPISGEREDRYIAGLSMGGYGALKIALREPERYCAVSSLSPVGDIQSFVRSDMAGDHYEIIFGKDRTVPDEDDILKLAEKNTAVRPRVYLAMGTEDSLYSFCVPVKEKLEALGYDLTCFEGPGNHTWDFWDTHIRRTLEWFEQS